MTASMAGLVSVFFCVVTWVMERSGMAEKRSDGGHDAAYWWRAGAGVVLTTVAGACVVVGTTLALAGRVVDELTRPGTEVDGASPLWGGWNFPTADVEPPAELLRPLSFNARDGTLLSGEFWAQPQPAPTIVISHGFRIPSKRFRGVAALEYAHGVNVLLFDYRGHGSSAPIHTSGGNAEINDLAAAVELAAKQPETLDGRIIIHGFSMGAAVALLLPRDPNVAAIIADSPYARLDALVRHIIVWQTFQSIDEVNSPGKQKPSSVARSAQRRIHWRRPVDALAWTLTQSGRVVFRFRFGHRLVARPDLAVQHSIAGDPPILLIHAIDDPLIPLSDAESLVAAAQSVGRKVMLYVTQSKVHCGSYNADPERYIQHIQAVVAGKLP